MIKTTASIILATLFGAVIIKTGQGHEMLEQVAYYTRGK